MATTTNAASAAERPSSSTTNAENVVKPPNAPGPTRGHHRSIAADEAITPAATPMAKHPRTLITTVDQASSSSGAANHPTRTRATAPAADPAATNPYARTRPNRRGGGGEAGQEVTGWIVPPPDGRSRAAATREKGNTGRETVPPRVQEDTPWPTSAPGSWPSPRI